MYTGQFWKQIQYIHVPFVLACLDGLLGSPVPMELLARTRNSYSTQGLRSITVAVSRVPRTTSGTGRKHTVPSSVSTHECVWLCVLGVSQLSISSMSVILKANRHGSYTAHFQYHTRTHKDLKKNAHKHIHWPLHCQFGDLCWIL